MESNNKSYKLKLGIFVGIGILIFTVGIFLIGKQQHLFDPQTSLKTHFSDINGLQTGNVVRFSGINVGIVEDISVVNDTTVLVNFYIKDDVKRFIREDSKVSISAEGLIGDKLLSIGPGSTDAKMVRSGQLLEGVDPLQTDAIMESVAITADNAAVISDELAYLLTNINNGKGTLGKLMTDDKMAKNIDQTIVNLKRSSEGLNENMEAAKNNFLLRGYFKKKERAAKKAKLEAEKRARANQNKGQSN